MGVDVFCPRDEEVLETHQESVKKDYRRKTKLRAHPAKSRDRVRSAPSNPDSILILSVPNLPIAQFPHQESGDNICMYF